VTGPGPRPGYDAQVADAYSAAREVPRSGLGCWREAVGRRLSPRPGMTVLDIGAGTGAFATAFHDWFGARVIAVEPAAAMRSRIPRQSGITVLGGCAEALPIGEGRADGAWLSTVIHHIRDLTAAARELRRALRPGAPVLIRSVFPGCARAITLAQFFPEIARVLGTYPTAAQTCAAFAAAGFRATALEAVPQLTAPDLATYASRLRRNADTLLRGITDEEYARGMDRLRAAAAGEPTRPGPARPDATACPGPLAARAGPVVDALDLLVLR
jgi:ubiquinone/menaquinone biosynthesis C-methylase UbiE